MSETSQTPIGLIGLGAMGTAFAERLRGLGLAVTAYDVAPDARERSAGLGVELAASPAEVGDRATVVLLSLPSSDAVMACLDGPSGVLGGNTVNVVVDMSTIGQAAARAAAATAALAGVDYLDAPVSGGPSGARAGRLTTMFAGSQKAIELARPVLESLCSKLIEIGETPGHGQVAKVLNNLMSASAIIITSEALAIGAKAGIAPAALLEAVNGSSGRNTASEVKFPSHVLTRGFDFGFRMDLMDKDVGLALAEAEAVGTPPVLTAAVEALWHEANRTLPPGSDCTAYAQVVEANLGVTLE